MTDLRITVPGDKGHGKGLPPLPERIDPARPFVIPDDGFCRVVSFSGGESSAYMTYRILDANNGLPENCHVVFANTGKEHPNTLDFVRDCGAAWGVEIVWLEYWRNPKAKGGAGDPKIGYRVASHETASRDGEPFECLIKANYYLPNSARRICTYELKVETIARYVRRSLGEKRHMNLMGMRADEESRVMKAEIELCNVDYPLWHAGITKQDILRYWRTAPFRLNLPEDGHLGNCDLCFLKGKNKLLYIIQKDKKKKGKQMVEWWERMEREMDNSPKRKDRSLARAKNRRFRKEESYADLRRMVEAQTVFPFIDGEDDPDCFCGD